MLIFRVWYVDEKERPEALLERLTIKPYRIDKAGAGGAEKTCFYFDVELKAGDLTPDLAIKEFLSYNIDDFSYLKSIGNIEKNFDIAFFMNSDRASFSFTFDKELMGLLGETGISLTSSIYLKSPDS